MMKAIGRMLMMIGLCMCTSLQTFAQADKAEQYLREAQRYNEQAEQYERDAQRYTEKANEYTRQAEKYASDGDLDRSRRYTSWANDELAKAQMRLKWAR